MIHNLLSWKISRYFPPILLNPTKIFELHLHRFTKNKSTQLLSTPGQQLILKIKRPHHLHGEQAISLSYGSWLTAFTRVLLILVNSDRVNVR